MTTHSAKCYQWHHDCAVAEVERRRSLAACRLQLARTLQDRLDEAREQRDALLDALRAAVADWDEEVSRGRWLDAARAAIAKAEGDKNGQT